MHWRRDSITKNTTTVIHISLTFARHHKLVAWAREHTLMGNTNQITNRYDILEQLGMGGMGVVYKAKDRLTGDTVALKQVLIPDHQLAFGSKAGTDDAHKLRLSLAHEFSILAGLRHPHILSVLDFGFDENKYPFYTMTLLDDGMDIKTFAEDLSFDRRLALIAEMLQALHYLHRRSILHRDLKPDNVFVTQDGQVKVMDFGLAKAEKQIGTSTKDDTIKGTISYMAPEQFQGASASVASDLYAVGIMAYEMLMGKYPYSANSIGNLIMQIMTHPIDCSTLPDALATWVESLLHKDPQQRPPSAYDALVALYQAQGMVMPAEQQAIRESFLQASTFVGRADEIQQLTTALDKLDAENAAFLIGGESGVGKSRLLDELRIQALVKGVYVMRGQGVDGGGLPFQLWRDIVRRMILMIELSDLQAGILKDIVPDVGTLLGREIPDAPTITGKPYQDRMILTIVDLFRMLPQPVVLLLEDLQWAGVSLAVLQQMLNVTEQLPKLMIVGSYRKDEMPNLPEKLAEMTHITLERLTPDAVSELSSAMLGDVGMDEGIVKLLHSQSEGNLFFLVETVRALAEASGDLQSIGQGDLPTGVFTGGMQALTQRRLAKVDPQYKDLQTFAALIGREIDRQLLAHVHGDAKVQAWLTNASEYGVVSIQDNVWRFAHDKLRETLLADMPEDTKPTQHRTAAETIEAVYPNDSAYDEELMGHWREAGHLDKELKYLDSIAEKMIEYQGDYDNAEALLQDALNRLPADDSRRVSLLNWLANIYTAQGQYDTARQIAKDALRITEKIDDQQALANSLESLARVTRAQGEFDDATKIYEQSLSLYRTLDNQGGIASILEELGMIATDQHQLERATTLYQQSLEIKQQLGDQRAIATTLNNLGFVAESQGMPERATELTQKSLEICQQIGDQRGIANALSTLGIIALFQEDYTQTTDYFERCLAMHRQLGEQHNIARTLNNMGYAAKQQGNYAQAIEYYQESLAVKEKLGNKHSMTFTLHNLAGIYYYQEDYEQALKIYQQSLDIYEEIDDQRGIAGVTNVMGIIMYKQDKQASDLFHKSLVIAKELQDASMMTMNAIGFATHFMTQGQNIRAAQYCGLAQTRPTRESDIHDYLAELMPKLEAVLSPEDLKTALEAGKKLDLDTVVQALLDEFGDMPT
jgi:tetratricopeptide (TPR) repeat protein